MNLNNKGQIKYALGLIKKYSCKYLIISVILSLLETVMPIINVYGLKIIIDSVETGKQFTEILKILILFFILMSLSFVFSSWYKKYYSPVEEKRIRGRLRENFYSIASNIDLKHYDDKDFYNKYVKALSEMDRRILSIIDNICNLVASVSCLITVVVLAASMDVLVIVFSITSVALNILLSIFTQNIGYHENNESTMPERKIQYVNNIFFQRQYAKEIRLFSLKGNLKKIFSDSNDNSIAITRKYVGKNMMLNLFSGLVNTSFIIGTLFYLAFRATYGFISIGDFAALLTASQSFNGQLESLFGVIPRIRENSLYIGYLREFSNYQSIIEKKTDGVSMPYGKPPKIEIHNISFGYPNSDNKVINSVDLTVNSGEIVAIVGENGVGKSTILKLLLRLYDVDDGSIKYDNIPITEYDIKSLRANIGVVFQDFQHYSMTIRDNLRCSNESDISDEDIYETLQIVGMEKRIRELPHGLDTTISKEFDSEGVEFSGGEYQKLALARAMIFKQGLVVFDEPSSALDPNSEKNFVNSLRNLCKDRTALLVSHRLAISRFADKIAVVEAGRIVEYGSHDELIKLSGKYAEMFNNQAEDYR